MLFKFKLSRWVISCWECRCGVPDECLERCHGLQREDLLRGLRSEVFYFKAGPEQRHLLGALASIGCGLNNEFHSSKV